ncbi:hypothetical protein HY837_05505 [archaeon]|nr:hypothetical protein [archaeon]
MTEKPQLNVKYLSDDGKYLGGTYNQEIQTGITIKLSVPDNNGLEHILNATIVSGAKNKDGLYSFLLEIDPPAPQRVIDMQSFRQMADCNVGSVEYDKIKIYTNIVLIIGKKFSIEFDAQDFNKKVKIQGEVISEEMDNLDPGLKYSFTIKLDNPLSKDDYEVLRQLDVDDYRNWI